MKRVLALAMILCAAAPAVLPSPSGPWNAAVRDDMLTRIEAALKNHYFFVDRVPELRAALEARRAQLVAIDNREQFAQAVNHVLQIAHDKHLNVFYSPSLMLGPLQGAPSAAQRARIKHFDGYLDSGFAATARLDGNIGYLRIDAFSPDIDGARHMIDSAMAQLAKTDALILDLRANGGGNPASVDYLLGYFLPPHTQVSGFLTREHGRVSTEPKYTATTVGAPKYLDRPLYVLTSADTFSGGEQCAYDLQASKRATLIGQTTGGGANPGNVYPLTENFAIFIPFGAARNPITKTNWDGVGVVPEVKTSAKGALLEGYTRALRAAQDDAPYAVAGRKQALANPAKALQDSLPQY